MALWGKDKDGKDLDPQGSESVATTDTPSSPSDPPAPVSPATGGGSGGKDTKDYGIWNSAVIEVFNDQDLVRVTLDLPDEDKDKAIVETSVGKAAARLVDNIAGYLLEAAKNVKVFDGVPASTPKGMKSRGAVAGQKSIWDYASMRIDGDLVEVTIDMPGDDWDEVIVRTSRPKAAARLVDNVAGFLLTAAQQVKPFDGSML